MMKKLAIAATLLLALGPARAEWTKVTESASDRAVYIDPAAIKVVGLVRQVQELWDYRDPDQFGDFSSILLVEYNCDTHQRRLLQSSGYKAQHAQGAISGVRTNPNQDWAAIAPQAIAAAILNIVCLN